MNEKKYIFATALASNYLGRATVMARSIKAFYQNVHCVACLVERQVPEAALLENSIDEIIRAEDLYTGHVFEPYIFKHDIMEACTSIKANLMLYLMNCYPEAKGYFYLDCDTELHASLAEAEESLKTSDIVLTPHLLSTGCLDMELSACAHGTYNLGFLGVANSKNARKVLAWWQKRLEYACFDEKDRGIFTDQKWWDIVPYCFDGVHILRHPGYNYASWNLSTRKISNTCNAYLIDGEPLVFTHITKHFSYAIEYLCRDAEAKPWLRKMLRDYTNACEKEELAHYQEIPWSYGSFASGEPIHLSSRKVYRKRTDMTEQNPFELSNRFFLEPENQESQAELELEILRNSRSWKITAPLRALFRALRSGAG